jgi:hypothetical protein
VDKYSGTTVAGTFQESWVYSGKVVEAILASTDSTRPNGRVSATFTTSGSTLALSLRCPATQNLDVPYTATATKFQIIANSDPNEIHTYSRQ